MQYPTGFPLAETQSLASVIRSGQLTTRDGIQQAIQDAWTLLGFGFSMYPGAPSPVINGPPPVGSAGPPAADALAPEAKAALADLHAAAAAAPKFSLPPDVGGDVVGSQLTKFWHEVVWPAIHHLLEAIFGPIDNGPN